MNKLLFIGAGIAIVSLSTDALAQGSGKDGDNMMRDARYMHQEDKGDMESNSQISRTSSSSSSSVSSYGDGMRNRSQNRNVYQDFTGPYVGGDVSYNMGSHEINDRSGPDGDVGLDGFEGGLFIGYGYTHNFSWLGGYAGLELAYDWSKADGDFDANSFEKNHAWMVSFRPGVAMHQDALAYAVLGYTRAEFEANGDDSTLDGFVIGAGSEFSTRSPFKLRLEYTYANYEDSDIGGVSFDGHENEVKAGAVLRF